MSLGLGHIAVRILLGGISESFLPIFPSRTLVLSQLMFKSLSSWSFFVCVWCQLVVEFHSCLHVAVQVTQDHLLRRVFLFHFILLPLCQI